MGVSTFLIDKIAHQLTVTIIFCRSSNTISSREPRAKEISPPSYMKRSDDIRFFWLNALRRRLIDGRSLVSPYTEW